MSNTSPEFSRTPGFDFIELTGERVRLRPTAAADAARAFDLITGEPGFTRYMLWDGPKSIAELGDTYGARWPEEMRCGTSYPLAIEERDKPGIMGSIHLRPTKYPGQLDFGYWLGKPYWSRGYTAEALALVCYFGFERLKADVILGSAFTGNMASRRVMEKNGFKFEGILRRNVQKDGTWIDLWHLSLLREEWQAGGIRPAYENLIPHMETASSGAAA